MHSTAPASATDFRQAALQRRRSRRAPAAGFTLIEMLVAITIMVILTTLVVAAFRRDDGDRLNASARLVQSYFEGGRSRAISDGKVRGIRLIPSTNDPFVVDSLVYIGATQHDTGTVNISFDTGTGNWAFANNTSGEWDRLLQRNLLAAGSRIEVPAGTGNWYYITDVTNVPPPMDEVQVAGHYTPSTWDSTGSQYRAQPATGVPYRLELAPAILPNTEPVPLERGTVIDLDASRVPDSWRPVGQPSPPPTAGGLPRIPGAGYSNRMDILFDSRGNPTGAIVPSGLIHLYVTTVGDVELTRNLFVNHPANGGTMTPPIVPADAPNVPQHEPYVITLFTQTGQVTVTQVDFTDLDANFQADVPFRFALRGKEAQ